MKLWLDDLRSPPDQSWHWCTTVDAAKVVLFDNFVTEASLDNDLGEGQEEGRRLILWLCEQQNPGLWPDSIVIHSANPVAGEYMNAMIDRYKP